MKQRLEGVASNVHNHKRLGGIREIEGVCDTSRSVSVPAVRDGRSISLAWAVTGGYNDFPGCDRFPRLCRGDLLRPVQCLVDEGIWIGHA